jgi:putative peptide zinc metalloprotease protein
VAGEFHAHSEGPVSDTTLVLNPELQSWPFDGAAREPMTLCEVPRADGSLARFVLPTRVVDVLRHFDGRPTGEVVGGSGALRDVPADDLRRLLEEVLVPRALLVPRGEAAHAPGTRGDRLSYLTLRVRLLPPRVVVPIAKRLGWMFARPVFAAVLAAVLAGQLWFWLTMAPAAGMALKDVKGSHAGLVLAVMALSTLVHELGHASAAARRGCTRLEIGWGLYYYMTILYTDLSEAWRLPRRDRAVLDVAGIYFQAVFGLLLLGAYRAGGGMVPLYCYLATNLAIAGSLNPFFRMDGYWLISDLLGVPNLATQRAEVVRRLAVRLFARGRRAQPLPLRPAALALLTAYSLAGTTFFVLTFGFAMQRLVVGIAVGYPALVAGFWATATAPPFRPLAVGSALLSVAWRGLVLFGVAKFTWLFLKRLTGGVVSLVASLRGAWRESRPLPAPGGAFAPSPRAAADA